MNSMNQRSGFTLADAIVFGACELTAIPLCHAGFDAIVSEHETVRGIVALLVGFPIGILGLGFPWVKGNAREWIQKQASMWWPAALLFTIMYVFGPIVLGRIQVMTGTQNTGRIVWNFDQTSRGEGFFLTMNKLNDQEIRIVGFGAHGKNISNDPISDISGFIRSDLTNAERSIYILAQDTGGIPNRPAFAPAIIPTPPAETFGIPPLADFDISTHDKPYVESGKDGIPVSKFLSEFGAFTLLLKYDGMIIQRRFSMEQVKAQIALFERQLNPPSTNPRVTRKPTAMPVQMFPPSVPMPAGSADPPTVGAIK